MGAWMMSDVRAKEWTSQPEQFVHGEFSGVLEWFGCHVSVPPAGKKKLHKKNGIYLNLLVQET